MKNVYLLMFILLALVLAGCKESSSKISSSAGEGTDSVAKVTDMHTLYPTGNALAIEITPNKNAVANKYYVISISYLKKGRCRTAVIWTDLEIQLEKPKSVYIPLTEQEASTLFNEPLSKYYDVFSVSIDPKPVDENTMQEFIKQGIVVIYH